jgi:hypothetical protein
MASAKGLSIFFKRLVFFQGELAAHSMWDIPYRCSLPEHASARAYVTCRIEMTSRGPCQRLQLPET